MYKNGVKRILDFFMSLCGIIVLSPLLIILSIWIKVDSKGDTPHDMPTHLLDDPDAFITKAGHFLRKTSLDELPQLFNILLGQMAVIGPRPALWNQDDLIALRDEYHANDVRPGLTGWAQIHGRDELEITTKAKLDGYYVDHLGFLVDVKCFFGTITSVLKHEGVVEGGTGSLNKD